MSIRNLGDRGPIAALERTNQTVTAATSTSIDCNSGLTISLTHGANITTLAFTNVPKVCTVKIIRTKDNSATERTLAWPASVTWYNNTGANTSPPSLLQSANAVQTFELFTKDGGTTFIGNLKTAEHYRNLSADNISFPSIAKRLAATWDASSNPLTYGANDYITSFVYDTRNDSDGGAWRFKCANTSWYSETLGTATRGPRKDFPMVALIVVRQWFVIIYDALDVDINGVPKMWMTFRTDGGYGLYGASGTPTAITALNGIIYFGSSNVSNGALSYANFIRDETGIRIDNANRYYSRNIVNRNILQNNVEVSYYLTPMISRDVTCLCVKILPNATLDSISGLPIPTVIVGTTAGISIIYPNGVVSDITQASGYSEVTLTPSNMILASVINSSTVEVFPLNDSDISSSLRLGVYSGSSSADLKTSVVSGTVATAVADTGIGTSSCLTLVSENPSKLSEGMTAIITTNSNSGWMPGDIRGAWLGTNSTTTVTASGELVINGTFTTNTSGWTTANGASLSIVANALRITGGTTDFPRAQQTITTVVGANYKAECTFSNNNGTVYLVLGTNAVASVATSGSLVVNFVATSTSTDILLELGTADNKTADFDNASVKLALPDLSYKNNGLVVNGTLSQTAVNTSSDLTAVSGFSNANYLELPYSSDLDFGTSPFCIMLWVKQSSVGPTRQLLYKAIGASGSMGIYTNASNNYEAHFHDGSYSVPVTGNLPVNNVWDLITVIRKTSTVEFWSNGNLVNIADSAASRLLGSLSGTSSLYVGTFPPSGGWFANGSIALLRISAYAPTADQIRKIYNDEKHLFQPNAKCLLGGTTNVVNALYKNQKTSILTVSTTDGASSFNGLVRTSYIDGTSVGTTVITSDNILSSTTYDKGTLLVSSGEAVYIQDSFNGKEEILYRDQSESLDNTNIIANNLTFSNVSKKLPSAWDANSVPTAYGSNDYVTSFIYDTRNDSDGGAWRFKCANTTWYNETLNTAIRGSRKEFPMVALIVARQLNATIYDALDLDINGCPKMWMDLSTPFNANSSHNYSCVFALNGHLYLGLGGDGVGYYEADFIKDKLYRIITTGILLRSSGLGNRGSAFTGTEVFYSNINLVGNVITDIYARAIPNNLIDPVSNLPIPTVAVGTTGGISVIHPNGIVANVTGVSVKSVYITESAQLYYTVTSSGYARLGGLPYSTVTDSAFPIATIGNTTIPATIPNGFSKIIAENAIGDSVGLNIFELNSAAYTKSMIAAITNSSNSGWLPGDIRGAWLGNTTTGNVTASTVLNDDCSSTSGWAATNSTISISSGKLRITSNGSGNAVADKAITVIPGETYYITVDITDGTASGANNVNIADASPGGNVILNQSDVSSPTLKGQFTAVSGTAYVRLFSSTSAAGQYTDFDNVSVKLAVPDLSYKAKPLIVNGTLTQTAVNTGSDLTAVSGFNASNYLEQPYNSDLDFGTGDFSIMFWATESSTASWVRVIEWNSPNGNNSTPRILVETKDNGYRVIVDDSAGHLLIATTDTVSANTWYQILFARRGNYLEAWLNGQKCSEVSLTTLQTLTNTNASLRIGASTLADSYFNVGKLALFRISAYAPTADQIQKMYNTEKYLFQTNTKCVLGGTTNVVNYIHKNTKTSDLTVATTDGVSSFNGLVRTSYKDSLSIGANILSSDNIISSESYDKGSLIVTATEAVYIQDSFNGKEEILYNNKSEVIENPNPVVDSFTFSAVSKKLASAWNYNGTPTAYGQTGYVSCFIYDTRNDSDNGAWVSKCSGTTWYNETLNTATRGSRKNFPTVALIVARATSIIIYDAFDLDTNGHPKMWMVASLGSTYKGWDSVTSIYALDGKLYKSADNNTTGDVYVYDFFADAMYYYDTSGKVIPNINSIVNRHTSATAISVISSQAIAMNRCRSVYARVLPGAPIDANSGLPIATIIIAGVGNVSVIHPTGQVCDITGFTNTPTKYLITTTYDIIGQGQFYDSVAVGGLLTKDTAVHIWLSDVYGRGNSSGYSTYPIHLPSDISGVYDISDDGLALATNKAICFLDKGVDTSSNGILHINTTSNSGWMYGNTLVSWIGNSTLGTITASGELISNGTFANTTGWTAINGASISAVSGALRLVGGTTDNPRAYTTITTVIGQCYSVSCDFTGNAGTYAYLTASDAANLNNNVYVYSTSASGKLILQFYATATTTYINLHLGIEDNMTVDFDNVSAKLSVPDNSHKYRGLVVNGTLTRSAVATGSELTAVSGFSPTNYLEQQYNSDLDFGTGDFTIMWWSKYTTSISKWQFERAYYTGGAYNSSSGFRGVYSAIDSGFVFQTTTDGFSGVTTVNLGLTNNGSYNLHTVVRRKGVLEGWVNGRLLSTVADTTNLTNTNAKFILGNSFNLTTTNDTLYVCMMRMSAYSMTEAQIQKTYFDERRLFESYSKCFLGGTSNYVSNVVKNNDTDTYFVGTVDGISEFDGVCRISYRDSASLGTNVLSSDNILDLSASKDMILVATSSEVTFIQNDISGKNEIGKSNKSSIEIPTNLTVNTLTFNSVVKRLPSAWDSYGVPTNYGATDYATCFVYDTRNDSDGGAWRFKCQGTSWYNETLNTAVRGSRKEFPMIALMVVRQWYVIIYDALDLDNSGIPKMWMTFRTDGAFGLFAATSGQPTCITALNGILYFGAGNVTNGALSTANFIKDETGVRIDNTYRFYSRNIVNRNISQTKTEIGYYTSPLISRDVLNVSVKVIPGGPLDPVSNLPIPTIAVATTVGVSIIYPSGKVWDITAAQGAGYVRLVSDTVLWFSDYNGHSVYSGQYPYADISYSLWYRKAYDRVGAGTTYPYITYGGTKRIAGNAVGSDGSLYSHPGVCIISENLGNPINGMVSYVSITSNSGWQPGDIRGAWVGNITTGNITASGELITNGTFTTNTSGWAAVNCALSVVSNKLRITTSASGIAFATQTLTTIPGASYQLVVNVTKGTATDWYFNVVNSSDSSALVSQYGANSGDTFTLQFTAISSTSAVRLFSNSAEGNYSGVYNDFDDVSVKLAVPGLSYKSKPLIVNGTLNRTNVATNSDLVAINGFNSSNYLEQAYNSDLDFGTGDMCVLAWINTSSSADQYILSRKTLSGAGTGAGFIFAMTSTTTQFIITDGTNEVNCSPATLANSGTWRMLVGVKRGSNIEFWMDGSFTTSTNCSAVTTLTNATGVFRVGCRMDGSKVFAGSLALVRASAYAPSPQQIRKIYEDEKRLFQPNAKCVLGGTSNIVASLAFDDSTDILHVATTDGISEFDGLVRVGYNDGSSVSKAIMSSDNVKSVSAAGGCQLFVTDAEAVFKQDAILGKEIQPSTYNSTNNTIKMSNVTTDATSTNLSPRIEVGERELIMVEARIIGRTYGAADTQRSSYVRKCACYRDAGGNITMQGSPDYIYTDTEVTGTANATLVVDTASQTIAVQVVGIAATRIVWTAVVTVTRYSEDQLYG